MDGFMVSRHFGPAAHLPRLSAVTALVVLLLGSTLFLSPVHASSAPPAGGPLYFDMGSTMIQYESGNCGYRSVLISYQMEYKDPLHEATLTGYRPKTEAVVFDGLTDYAQSARKPNLKKVTSVIRHAVQDLLGADVVSDVFVTRMEILGN
ncbi:hypothetical protein HH303_13795 [Rhodospirillaceae bacterium KN72]|uniref:Flagellar protein FliL n=1 Tax=Pacificispira spongiicola TaxID=2729598 RepID=A0A7Y0HGD8_9PROT|nr:hypothetical protein [Pacificispira spongiicola]NMM45563.1 hypothetical protein [Pacificispira spongiicola]